MNFEKEKFNHFGLIPDIAAKKYEDRTAIYFQGKELKFQKFFERSNKVANALTDLGVEPGECVCLYIPNTLQFPEAFFGIIKAGGIALPLNLRMPADTLKYIVDNSGSNLIIASPVFEQKAKELAENAGVEKLLLPRISGGRIIDYAKLVDDARPDFWPPKWSDDEVALLLYTSGTTGLPKGVPFHTKI